MRTSYGYANHYRPRRRYTADATHLYIVDYVARRKTPVIEGEMRMTWRIVVAHDI